MLNTLFLSACTVNVYSTLNSEFSSLCFVFHTPEYIEFSLRLNYSKFSGL